MSAASAAGQEWVVAGALAALVLVLTAGGAVRRLWHERHRRRSVTTRTTRTTRTIRTSTTTGAPTPTTMPPAERTDAAAGAPTPRPVPALHG